MRGAWLGPARYLSTRLPAPTGLSRRRRRDSAPEVVAAEPAGPGLLGQRGLLGRVGDPGQLVAGLGADLAGVDGLLDRGRQAEQPEGPGDRPVVDAQPPGELAVG